MESKLNDILAVAEKMAREGGYNAFSFREIAKAVGIKSSSVHYHFPTKADLGAAVARNYTDAFMANLGEVTELMEQDKDPIEVYVMAFKGALVKDKQMCLCGLLGAEVSSLPESVVAEINTFFKRNIEWLTEVYRQKGDSGDPGARALQTLSLLEGALLVSMSLNDPTAFDKATALLET